MTLKQLEAFYRAAICDSFAIAAERLHVSVSTLSKRITDLEASLGQTLFDRDQYRASLTTAGHALLPHVRQLLDQADALRQVVRDDAGVQGNFRFAVGELSSLTWLPRFIAQTAQRYPNLHLEPHIDVGPAMEAGVESGELDFAVISGTSSRQRIVSFPVGEADFDWFVSPALYPSCRTVADAAARHISLITMPQGAGTYRMLEEWIRSHGIFWRSCLTCNTWGGVTSLVLEGVGIGFMPNAWARPLAERGLLVKLEQWQSLPSMSYSMQMRRDDSRAGMLLLKELLMEVVDFSLPIRFLSAGSDRAAAFVPGPPLADRTARGSFTHKQGCP